MSPSGNVLTARPHHATGYWYFAAWGHGRSLSLHRFIAYQLFGDEALAAECVRHKDDVRSNNRFDNITYGTRSQNQYDIPQEKRSAMGVKRNRWKRRFTADEVREIRALLAVGWSLKRLRARFGGGYGTFANIRDGRTYLDVDEKR